MNHNCMKNVLYNIQASQSDIKNGILSCNMNRPATFHSPCNSGRKVETPLGKKTDSARDVFQTLKQKLELVKRKWFAYSL